MKTPAPPPDQVQVHFRLRVTDLGVGRDRAGPFTNLRRRGFLHQDLLLDDGRIFFIFVDDDLCVERPSMTELGPNGLEIDKETTPCLV